MKKLKFFGSDLEYDETKQYLTVQVVGSIPPGEVVGKQEIYDLERKIGLMCERKKPGSTITRISEEMLYMEMLLNEGELFSYIGPITLEEGDREKYERTWKLYRAIIEKVADKVIKQEIVDKHCSISYVTNLLKYHDESLIQKK